MTNDSDKPVASTKLEAALEHADRGEAVFPVHFMIGEHCSCEKPDCANPAKHPLAQLAPRGVLNATTNLDIIRRWWERYPKANIGMATGAKSGIIVFDVDGDIGFETLAALNITIAPTRTVITGREGRGRHYYFRHPGGNLRNFQGKDNYPGLDFRGDGGYVIVPPSVHKSSNVYAYEIGRSPGEIALAELLPELLALIETSMSGDGPGDPATVALVTEMLERHGLYTGFDTRGYGTTFPLARCVTAPTDDSGNLAHADGAALIVFSDGNVTHKCHHNRCQGRSLEDFLAALGEPDIPYPEPIQIDDPHADDSPEVSSDDPDDSDDDSRPVISIDDRDLPRMTGDALAALAAGNVPPRMFSSGAKAVRIETAPDQAPTLQELTPTRLRHELARSARFESTQTIRRRGRPAQTIQESEFPPIAVVDDMLASPRFPLPQLDGIVEAPVFGPNGELQLEPGYHAASRMYFAPKHGFRIDPVSEYPTGEELATAVQIISDVLADFPFVDESDRAAAIGLFISPYIRPYIAGPIPLHMIEANQAGTGKDLLTLLIIWTALGHPANILTEAGDDDEWRKRITATMLNLPMFIHLANINRTLDSGALAQAISAETWSDRLLGRSETITVPNRAIFIATANNPSMSTEIARRTVRIRLDAKQDRPWERTGFRHPNLLEYVDQNRGRLVWAALTIIRHWFATGAKPGTRALGSFEAWSRTIGGILDSIGIPGFLTNLSDFYESADLEGGAWRELIDVWWATYGDEPVRVANLFDLIENEGISGFNLRGSDKSQKTSFGMQIRKQRDRIYGDYKIVSSSDQKNQKTWQLRRAEPESEAERAARADRQAEVAAKVTRLDRTMGAA